MEYIYAVLLLHKLGKEITEENIKKIIEAAGAIVDEAKIKTVVASLKGVDIDKVLKEAVATPVSAEAVPAATKPEVKEEKKEESVEGLAALFG